MTEAKATIPYDQAAALEAWLRVNITYNDQIPAPAQGQDGVDYVLFVTRQGFCDYYASAMAVMARALGIPARIATGYAQGQFDAKLNAYEVYQNNAHTWPETISRNMAGFSLSLRPVSRRSCAPQLVKRIQMRPIRNRIRQMTPENSIRVSGPIDRLRY